MDTAATLRAETNKWLAKLEAALPGAKPTALLPKQAAAELLQNIRAYVKDCRHFIAKSDWVNAFEAVVYAWGMYEAALNAGILAIPQARSRNP